MDNPSENTGDAPGRMVLEYLLEWPFMCHAGMVLLLVWITSCVHLNVALVCTLGFLYLYQIENRQREKLNRRIRHEERKIASVKRISEGETVRWMNKTMESMWPFLEDFSSQVLLVPLFSFMDRFKPWSAKKLIVQNLSLGKTPPVITMIRVLDQPVAGDNLAIEASFEWVAAKDMVAVVAVQVRRRIGLGIWTTFHICNLHIEGKVKLGIKLKEGWPVIERLRLCFATAPFVQMTAHPLYNYGVDVTELPGIAQWMDRLVADALAQTLVEPNMLEIDMEKLMRDVMRPQGPAQQLRGDWLSQRESPPAANVTVEVLEAADLRVGDRNGYSDPFVKVTLGIQRAVTKVKWKNLNPKWNETFKFSIASWKQPNTMLLKVRDKDRFIDDQLGMCIVEINQYRDGKRHDFWLPLQEVNTGKIHLAITVDDNQTDSQSSEENSTTFERTSQSTSQEFDLSVPYEGLPLPVSPGSGLSQPLRASSKGRISTRLRSLKSGKSLPTLEIPAPEDSSSSKVGRQRSGIFSGSKSSRKSKTPQVGFDREKSLTRGEDLSRTVTSGEASSLTTSFSTPMEAEAAVQSSDKVIDVGFGEPGAVKVCQLGDIERTTTWSKKNVIGSNRPEDVSDSQQGCNRSLEQASSEGEALTNIEDDGGAARKLRSVGRAMQGKLHRAKKGFEKGAEPSPPSSSCTPNGAMVHLTLDPSVGQPVNISTGIPSGHEPTATTSLSVDQGMNAGAPVDEHDSEKQHLRNRAKGFLNRAADQLGHQFTRRTKSRKSIDIEGLLSSGELTSSDELASMGELGHARTSSQELAPIRTEVPLSGAGDAHPRPQQQLGSTTGNQVLSEPPNRPPPGLPHPVSPPSVQANHSSGKGISSSLLSSEPSSLPVHPQQNFPAQSHEFIQPEGLAQLAPPELDGARNR